MNIGMKRETFCCVCCCQVAKNILLISDDAFIQREPYGVALIMSAWNYPVQLAFGPMIGALAAGWTNRLPRSTCLERPPHKNVVSQDRWPMVTGSVICILKCLGASAQNVWSFKTGGLS